MSLDVHLTRPLEDEQCICRCGHVHMRQVADELFWANITHNLNRMADAAGIYEAVWRPDEHGYVKAKDLVEPLATGLARLKATPDHFRQFNPANGWGTYEDFVEWVERYLAACQGYPDADVSVSR